MADSTPTPQQPNSSAAVQTAEQVSAKRRVFLAWSSADILEEREQMAIMLQKAGCEVVPQGDMPEDEFQFQEAVKSALASSDSSVHILGGAFGQRMAQDPSMSRARYQYLEARKHSRNEDGKYRRSVWALPMEGRILEGEQSDFITEIQNGVGPEVMLSTVNNAQQYIEETLAFYQASEEREPIPKEYDIAFISNVQDAGDCYEVIEALGNGLKISTLTVVPEKDLDYRVEAEDIILKSHMAVVFFKEANDWGISFVKQIWKRIGGVSAGVPFLLVGEDEPRRNRFLKFEAPQIRLEVVKKKEVLDTIQEMYRRVQATGRILDKTYCPYTGLRPFNENESVFFKGRDIHISTIIDMLAEEKFTMVTGSSGDGKSSLIYAGVIPSLKGGFLRTQYTKWAVADFRPERSPLKNLASAIGQQLRIRDVDSVENQLSYGFSALVDLYKDSSLYCDTTSEAWLDADEETRKLMRRQSANLLILVDQFEEFFTNTENYREGVASPLAQITVNVLIETIRIAREEELPIYVVFTMRSDYIGQCVSFRGFPELIGHSTYFVPRLKREEIQEVIEKPAQLNGNKITHRLSQRILNDLGDGIDQLPVLQHALHQIWTCARDGEEELDLLHYAKVGGLPANRLPKDEQPVFNEWFEQLTQERKELYDKPKLRNILNRHANELFYDANDYYNARGDKRLTDDDAQFILRTVFSGLTKIDENRAVRNRMTLQELTDMIGIAEFTPEIVNLVVNIFREPGNTFVQPFIEEGEADTETLANNTVLDITHEALIRNWDRLIDWAEQEYRSVQIYSDFKIQVNRWLAEDASNKYLLTTGTYNYFNTWYEDQKPTPAWIRRYITPEEMVPELDPMEQATQYLEDIEEYLALSKARIDRNRRMVMFVIGIVSVLFIFALIAAYLANNARIEAEEQRQLAVENAQKAEFQRLQAIRSAQEAQVARRQAELQANRAEQQAIIAENQRRIANGERLEAEKQRRLAELKRQEAEEQRRIADTQRELAETQRRLAEQQKKLAQENARIAIFEAQQALIQKNNAEIMFAAFQSQLAAEQVEAGNAAVAVQVARNALPSNIYNKDKPYLPEAEASLYYAVDAIANAEAQHTFDGHKNNVVYNRFSPDGLRLITTSWDMTARIWDVNTGNQVSVLRGHKHIVDKAYFSPDGRFLVTVADDFTARLWDLRNSSEVAVYRGHAQRITSAAYSPINDRVVTVSTDNTGRLFDARTGKLVAELTNHQDDVLFTTFGPNGSTLVTTSLDNTARVWDAKTGALLSTLTGHKAQVNHAAYSPDGRYLVTVSNDRQAKLWDVRTGQERLALVGHTGSVTHVAFSHSGRKVITSSDDNTARVWDVSNGQQLDALREHTGHVHHATFSPDDQRIATSSQDGSVRLWDGNFYEQLAVYKGLPQNGYHAAFSPDSRKIAVAEGRKTIKIYKVLPPGQALIDLAKQSYATAELSSQQRRDLYLEDPRIQEELDRDSYLRRLRENESSETEAPDDAPATEEPGRTLPDIQRQPLNINTLERLDRNPVNVNPRRDNMVRDPEERVNQTGFHVVQPGETIWRIARMYEMTPDRLRRLNKLKGNSLQVGQRLQVD